MGGGVTTYGIVASNFVSLHCYSKDLGEKIKRKSSMNFEISKMRKGIWQIKKLSYGSRKGNAFCSYVW